MNPWKKRLYDTYVSTGQAGGNVDPKAGFALENYHYFRQVIRRHVPADRQVAVLDLACGHGAFLLCLRKLGYQNLVGVDISAEQIRLAHELGLKEARCEEMITFLRANRRKFDVIIIFDVLEHLQRDELLDCMDLVGTSLTDNGIVLIHVPNAASPVGGRIRYGDLTHESSFTCESISQLLNACGLRKSECFEDRPVIHGFVSLCRWLLWGALTAPIRLLLAAETGTTRHILSQNMLAVGRSNGKSA